MEHVIIEQEAETTVEEMVFKRRVIKYDLY